MSAFGDRDEHDVHDTDAADNERNTGNNRKNARNNREECTGGVSDVVAKKYCKVSVTVF